MPDTAPKRSPEIDATPTLLLLGGIDLRNVAVADANRLLGQQKVVGLLAYLALAPEGRQQRRDRVVGLLWPELDQTHARGALRKAVHLVRDALGKEVIVGRSDEELMLDSSKLRCDAAEFTEHVRKGHLQAALELYHGELLPGFHLPDCAEFGNWLDGERAQLIEDAQGTAWAMAVRLEEEDQQSRAGRMARTAVRYDWSNERVLRRAMQLLARIGDRAGALRLFDETSKLMEKELETKPSKETLDLAAQIRQG